nr:GNAT family N-acetyltransferase [Pseudozobellia sp. WGM2]
MKGEVSPFFENQVHNQITDKPLFNGEEQVTNLGNINFSIVWDVPEYLSLTLKKVVNKISVKKIRQYKGFLLDLSACANVDQYLSTQLSSRNRKKLRSKKRKLEVEHEIRYSFYYGNIEKELYDLLFSEFRLLLERRFDEKKVYNNNLNSWNYYYELVYPLILEKKASMFAIYDGDRPITISLHFHLTDTVFSYIQTYDIQYSQYNMGDISMFKRLEYFMSEGCKVVDLSMGETDYKMKWCNNHYSIYFYIFYNHRSLKSSLKAITEAKKLQLKQFLRDKDILGKMIRLDKLKYRFRELTNKTTPSEP